MISPASLSSSPTSSPPASWSRSDPQAPDSRALGSRTEGDRGSSASDEEGEDADPEVEALPEVVGPYRVGPRIGRGGMGRVHEAVHLETGRAVALKLPKEGASARACARLLREARTARAAAGEHVVEVFDAGLDATGRPFVAMERLRGEDLGALLRREGRLGLEDAVALTLELLRGLERVHGAGVVHRDLKPENLVVLAPIEGATEGVPAAPAWRLKIVDFGVSKARTGGVLVPGSLTRDGVVLGTPLYMSPEQAQGLPDVDERSDLWSVGAIFHQCLTGRAPHAGATYEQIVVAVCATDAPDVRTWNPAVPEPVAKVLARALARDRSRRFQDARSMRDALVRAAAGDLDAASHDLATATGEPMVSSRAGRTQPLPLVRLRRVSRRAQIVVAVVSVALGAGLALAGILALGERGAEHPAAVPRAGRPAPLELAAELPPAPPESAPESTPRSTPDAEALPVLASSTPARIGPPTPAPGTMPRGAPRRGVAAGLPLKER